MGFEKEDAIERRVTYNLLSNYAHTVFGTWLLELGGL